jgi:iron(III) transport system permease protein
LALSARWWSPWVWGATGIALLVAVPVLLVLAAWFQPAGEHWGHLVSTVLPRYLTNSLVLVAGVGALAGLIGIATAWLVTMCQFPGRWLLSWMLLLPLAMPAYLLAYAYGDMLEFAGPVQTTLRSWFGWGRDDYWFPQIRSLGGAVIVMASVLYPYVYLTARAAFLDQSVCSLEAGRTLGLGPWACFRRISLPLARPAIVVGVALVAMETLADYGTVDHFAVDTFTTGIYRTWTGLFDPVAASRLAGILLVAVALLLGAERLARGRASFAHSTNRYRNLPRWKLSPLWAGVALLVCGLPLLIGFIIPTAFLLSKAIAFGTVSGRVGLWEMTANSLLVAGVAGGIALVVAILIAYAQRLHPNHLTRGAARVGALGYAVPGSVIAIAVVVPLGWLDNTVADTVLGWTGWDPGLILSGTIAGLLYAYVARFLAAALGTVEAGLGRIRPELDKAARTLGCGNGGVLTRVHLPLMMGSCLTAVLLVFVDVMKELPATMIVRPFGFETLAVSVHQMASDERINEAALPALLIVAAGLLPVLLLTRMVARGRAGASVAT